MKNTCLLERFISSFQGTSYKRMQDTASLPVPSFLIALHRVRIHINRYHFYNILEPNPTFTEKKVSSRIFIL